MQHDSIFWGFYKEAQNAIDRQKNMSKILIRNNQQGGLVKTFTEFCIDAYFSKKAPHVITVFYFILGICLMCFTDLSKYMVIIISVIICLGAGQMFLQYQNQGKIPEKLKKFNILAEATCLGVALGGIISGQDIWAKGFCLIIWMMIFPFFITLFFTVETEECKDD